MYRQDNNLRAIERNMDNKKTCTIRLLVLNI